MFKISEIISMPVYSLYEGVIAGTIKNFLYDNKQKKVKGFFVFDDEGENFQYFIDRQNIFAIGSDFILIKNKDKIENSFLQEEEIINRRGISIGGEDFGKIIDLYFDDNFNVLSLQTDKNVVLPASSVVKIGKDIIVFDVEGSKVNIAKMKPTSKILMGNLPPLKVNILQEQSQIKDETKLQSKDENPKIKTIPIITQNFDESSFIKMAKVESAPITEMKIESKLPRTKSSPSLPARILYNPQTLIGKQAIESIYGLNGEIVVRQGQLVTDKIFQKAKKHSKLYELTNSVL